jgi:A/G-specific adenine glycosylase
MPAYHSKQNRINLFTGNIINWHLTYNKRIMPWKGEKDPYKIWLSEVILQQTRVMQGLEYYKKFTAQYPTLESLAKANDDDVFKLWEGLGYYSRCRNLLYTARLICKNYEGKFPRSYDEIVKLKGVGPYTASAISSFAYGLPHAVVDGNVYRVLSRYFGETIAIDSTQGKKAFNELADKALYRKDPAAYNQAIMDFGATVCKPQIAECQHCVLRNECVAFKQGLVNKLPVKEKKLKKSKRWFYYYVFLIEGQLLVNKRGEKDIWHGLNEFYLYESEKAMQWNKQTVESFLREQIGVTTSDIKQVSQKLTQQLTHQTIEGQFILVEIRTIPEALQHFEKVPVEKVKGLAFPKFINMFLLNNNLHRQTQQGVLEL